MPKYRVHKGGLHDRFLRSRAKVQVFGGGFANGKTAALCIKALQVAKEYPGANILLARSTYPKLNDTLRKEFIKWCPKDWIRSFPKTGSENTCYMTNGSVVNFRYVAQQGKSAESSTSNLLSATYDFVGIDQMEDPEIGEKDFDDILGRLRGMAKYVGDDPTMPKTGPRWFVITLNPTRNWIYRKIVKPYHDWCNGVENEELLVDPDTGEPIVELFEGSTYENQENLEGDFIRTLEIAYQGQMRDRFLLGQWAAYEGLVYPEFDDRIHVMTQRQIVDYYNALREKRIQPKILEGYDHGLAVPSCYLLAFVDLRGNVLIFDGWYESGVSVDAATSRIKQLRRKYGIDPEERIWADPALFRRGVGDKKTVGTTVAGMFQENGIHMQRGNNDIENGIMKVKGYLLCQEFHNNPITLNHPAPFLYVADTLTFVRDEFTEYYWKRDTQNDQTDKPVDKNDHAMDTIKYMLTRRPRIANLLRPRPDEKPAYMKWHEYEHKQDKRAHRHAA
jgi:hypothetical protein